MANYETIPVTRQQYENIIVTMKKGSSYFRPNQRIAFVLMLEANLGMRIEDILLLTPDSFVYECGRYRLAIKEQKTRKKRPFPVSDELHQEIMAYCEKYGIKGSDRLYPFGERNVQKYLQKVTDYLGYDRISTHSFRKYFAHQLYEKSGKDIRVVQYVLQHVSPAVTQRYLNLQPDNVEDLLGQQYDWVD